MVMYLEITLRCGLKTDLCNKQKFEQLNPKIIDLSLMKEGSKIELKK